MEAILNPACSHPDNWSSSVLTDAYFSHVSNSDVTLKLLFKEELAALLQEWGLLTDSS